MSLRFMMARKSDLACSPASPGEPACLQEISRPLNFAGCHVPASGTQTFVTITAVPEPATLALLAAAAGLAALATRRK